MKIFITGTDTNIGKTTISSWLCLHSGYSYFKPIQTGAIIDRDSNLVSWLSGCYAYPEVYRYPAPVSPHLAARLAGDEIDISKIHLPAEEKLIIEGAGGIYVPINDKLLMVDLIEYLAVPVLIVASSALGTINHTLLTISALKDRSIEPLGVILNGEPNIENVKAIEYYGKTKVLASFPKLSTVDNTTLSAIPLSDDLKRILS